MKTNQKGFSLIEIVVIIAIMSVFFVLLSINLIGAKPKASLVTSITTFVGDVKQQQIKAMTGTTASGVSLDFGMYMETNRYTLFNGSSYSPLTPTNFIVNLDDYIQFSNINLPSSSIVFNRESGEVAGFSAGSNTLTIKNTLDSTEKTITVNRYGVVTSVN